MVWSDDDLEGLVIHFEGGCSPLDNQKRRIALAIFKELALGRPVDPTMVARRAELSRSDVGITIQRWPGVRLNEAGLIVGFGGLTLSHTPYAILIADRRLYAWCAWDTLFMAQLASERTRVESRCGMSGAPVRLLVGPRGVEGLDPRTTVVSFPESNACPSDGDGIESFCAHSRFFASSDEWASFSATHDVPTFTLSARDAWRLGRIGTRIRYGVTMEADS